MLQQCKYAGGEVINLPPLQVYVVQIPLPES